MQHGHLTFTRSASVARVDTPSGGDDRNKNNILLTRFGFHKTTQPQHTRTFELSVFKHDVYENIKCTHVRVRTMTLPVDKYTKNTRNPDYACTCTCIR